MDTEPWVEEEWDHVVFQLRLLENVIQRSSSSEQLQKCLAEFFLVTSRSLSSMFGFQRSCDAVRKLIEEDMLRSIFFQCGLQETEISSSEVSDVRRTAAIVSICRRFVRANCEEVEHQPEELESMRVAVRSFERLFKLLRNQNSARHESILPTLPATFSWSRARVVAPVVHAIFGLRTVTSNV